MTAPELPQPIYPTGSPTPGPGTPPPGYGPPLTPPPHNGGPSGPGGSGGGGIGGNKNVLIAAGAVVVVAVLAVVAFAISSDDGGDTASGDPGSGQTGNEGGGEGNGEGGGDVSGRAQRVAAQQIIGAESSTVSCIAGALESDQQMLDTLENQPEGVVLPNSSDANSYASMIMGCASPGEMLDQMVAALPTFGYDAYSVDCFEQQAAGLSTGDWEEFIRILVQPDRLSELEQLVGELTFC